MSVIDWIIVIPQAFFLTFFVLMNAVYVGLNLISIKVVYQAMRQRALDDLPSVFSGLELPVSLLLPAYNEEAGISDSVRSLLQLNYPEFEVIVINDGSRDGTLEVLKREFSLLPFPAVTRARLKTRPVRAVYRSSLYPNLRVIDKENGGKADALNAGINDARYPLFCGVDADSVLQQDSLKRLARPMLEDETVIAAGGSVRLVNGCRVSGGFLEEVGLPNRLLPLMQVVEYLRAFLFGRMGWVPLNALLIISGTFGLFRKELVVEAGGYRTDTVGEDMELVVRLHRLMTASARPYRIVFVPDPICWTEAPEDLATLRAQRMRWQRGLAESLWFNRQLLFRRNAGPVSWLAFPFTIVFEMFGPLVEIGGYLFMFVAYLLGLLSFEALAVFLFVAIGFGLLLSVSGLLLEEMSFHLYLRPRDLPKLCLALIAENFGYRQLNSFWRLLGLASWLFRWRRQWGHMRRSGRRQEVGDNPPLSRAGETSRSG
jgi:cellulose synthase/poly-beta-1,6-N-acetylglucosamine synthase-like glycosyltransferase